MMCGEVLMQLTDGSPQIKRWEAPLQAGPVNPYSRHQHHITEVPRLGELCLAQQLPSRKG
jgi:hypothetical protein